MLKQPAFLLPLVGALALAPLMATAMAKLFFDIRVQDVTRDVASIAEIHPLSGALSSLGILLWWTSATVWFFTAAIKRTMRRSEPVGFLIYSGMLSAYLGLDDLFQFHEHLAPRNLLIPEWVVYAVFLASIAIYVWRYAGLLRRSDGIIFVLSLACLALSMGIDTILEPWLWRIRDWSYLIEDGLKWVGIVMWTVFCVVRCHSEIGTRLVSTSVSRIIGREYASSRQSSGNEVEN